MSTYWNVVATQSDAFQLLDSVTSASLYSGLRVWGMEVEAAFKDKRLPDITSAGASLAEHILDNKDNIEVYNRMNAVRHAYSCK